MKWKQVDRNRLLYMILVAMVMVLGILSRKVEGLPILIVPMQEIPYGL